MSFLKAANELSMMRSKANVIKRMRVMIKFNDDADKAQFMHELMVELESMHPRQIGRNEVISLHGIDFEFAS